MRASVTAARLMRTALKNSGEISFSAFLMTTKVAPQMSVMNTKQEMGLERAGHAGR